VARAYVRLKEIEHVQSDYLDKCVELEVDGRVHPNTDVLKAVTGRVAMGSPPFHQFPSRGSMKIARNIVLADEGDSLTSLDWAQIEPVIAANIAHDTSSLNEYESGSGDMYAGIAKQAKISRDKAKVTLLAQLYGEGFAKLADTDSQWKGYGNLVDKLARSIAEERGELYQKSQVEVSGNPFAGFDEIDIGDDGKLRGVK
jgi:hypothetical protein